MSIVIRLQNLPLHAKSADIRQFFGGLRIPAGGVHILGGEKGDAFILFMSDEDARIAMRKDGGKIKNFHVKLFLSSRMEMQHEVEKKTKCDFNFDDIPSPKMHSSSRTPEIEVIKSRSSEKKRSYSNRNPGSEWKRDKPRVSNDYHEMSRSSNEERIISSRESPKRYSRSPKRYSSSRRSPPPKSRTYSQRRKSVSPENSRYTDSEYQIAEQSNSEIQSMTQSQLQAELEKRITAEIEKNCFFNMVMNDKTSTECNLPGIGMTENMTSGIGEFYQHNNFYKNVEDLSSLRGNTDRFQETNYKFDYVASNSYQEDSSLRHPEMFESNVESRQKYGENFYITLSGLDRLWNFREVQIILKGVFAPQNHIRFERDVAGYKTGTAYVKITNRDDFNSILKKKLIYFNGLEIFVSVCPDSISCKYFSSNFFGENFSENNDYCYTLKGLPFSCSYDDIVNFFHGLNVADVVIFHGEDGRATGTGFVSFTCRKDFEEALSQNGKKILHRYIEMLPCTQRDMKKAKKSHPNASSFIPYSKLLSKRKLPGTRRPLCALLTGLPADATAKKVASFFSESGLKPDAIHLTVKKNRLSDGRGFVEFTNFLDFDCALKFHGKQLQNNIICVKQILYDEMVNILDTQKARHHFETPVPSGPALNIPEKVPYLWEPPDASEEEQVDFSTDYKREFTNDHEASLRHSHSSNLSFVGSENQFISNKDAYVDQNLNLHSSKRLMSTFIPHNAEINPPEIRRNTEVFMNNPLDINIKNDFGVNAKPNEMLSSFKTNETNRTRSKSAEYEAAVLDFLNNSKIRKSKSPDRSRRSHREKSLPKTERGHKDDKSRYTNNSNSKSQRSSRHYRDSRFSPYSRESSKSDRSEKEEKSKGCVVHISNVSVSAGIHDLMSFFEGFDFYEDTLIRRYTDEGEPTHDIRMTFYSEQEAKRAIKTLNKRYFHNMPVNMVIL